MSTNNKLEGKRKQPDLEPENYEEKGTDTVPAFLIKVYNILNVFFQ